MESETAFKSRVSSHRQSRLRTVRNTVHRHPRYLWTVCATISLLTSKHLFSTAGLSFPVHIQCIHWAAVAIYLAGAYAWCRRKVEATKPAAAAASWTCLTILAAIMALSVGCTFQAILHFPNTTALVMFATLYSALFTAASLAVYSAPPKYCRFYIRPKDCVWVLLCLVGLMGMVLGEYRLLVKGFESIFAATIGTAVSRGMYLLVDEKVAFNDADIRRLNALFGCAGLMITGIWLTVFTEHTWKMMWSVFQWKCAPLLAVNVVFTAVAMVLGKSVLLPIIASERRSTQLYRHQMRLQDSVTILVLTGAVGLYSTLSIRRTYTTYAQLCGYFVTILCLGADPMLEFVQSWKSGVAKGYSRVSPSTRQEPVDDERATTSEDTAWSDNTEVSPLIARPFLSSETFRRFLVVALVAASFWSTFLCLNFRETMLPHQASIEPILDTDFEPPLATEIVISMYKEPISDVRALISNLRNMTGLSEARVSIYLKDADANVANIQKLTRADNITMLPNVGREGETYLHHILTNWDRLAHQTFFLQADVHNPREFYPHVKNYFVPGRGGMLNLGWSGNVCDCNNCADQFQFFDRTRLFPMVHQQINNSTTCSDVLLSYKGQFVVSAARLRGTPKPVYESLHDAFVNPDSWAHQEPFLEGRYNAMSQPVFGYYMERMWNLLFQCAHTDVAWKCPSLLSGWRIGGSKADCQCFDDA